MMRLTKDEDRLLTFKEGSKREYLANNNYEFGRKY